MTRITDETGGTPIGPLGIKATRMTTHSFSGPPWQNSDDIHNLEPFHDTAMSAHNYGNPGWQDSEDMPKMGPLQDTREFILGWSASTINIVATFPLNKLMFRQQLYGIRTMRALKQLQREGLFTLYRGLLPPLMQKSACMAIMFGMYDKYQVILRNTMPSMPVLVNKSTAAMLAGCTEAILTPFERVQVLLQDKRQESKFKNTMHTFRELGSHGPREYYRGLSCILMRNGPSNVLFFLLREPVKNLLPVRDTIGGHLMSDFVSGSVLGATISTLVYPINVVKTRMQSRIGGSFRSFRATFMVIFRERDCSLRKMFRGVHINFSRSMISWGIINASYELLKKTFFQEK